MRRVAVLRFDNTALGTGGGYIVFTNWIDETLRRMGYQVDTIVLDDDQTGKTNILTVNAYEFAVMVHPFSVTTADVALAWVQTLYDGNVLPLFIVNHAEDATFSTTLIGVNRNNANAYIFVTFDGIGEIPCYAATQEDTDTSGKDITPIAWQTGTATNLVMWKMTSGTYNVYGSAEGGSAGPIMSMFPILMQYAINDGEILPPPRKLVASMDTDDVPEDDTYTWTAADMEAFVADLKDAQIVTTIGIPASKTIGSRNELVDIWEPNGVNAVIRREQIRNGGPLYPIEHMGSTYWSTTQISGSPSGGQTKAAIDTFYRDHIDNMHDHGIWQGWNDDGLDSYGYHYFNTNRIDGAALQLATPRTTILADPTGAAAIAGYGWKVARFDGNSVAYGVGVRAESGVRQRNDYFGINLVSSNSPINATTYTLDYATNADDYALIIMQSYLTYSAILSRPLYMHGGNGNDYRNAGLDVPLRIAVQKIGLINNFCVDTLRCGHPSEYANNGSSLGG